MVTLWSRAALTRHLAGRALHVWQRPLVAALPAVWPLLPAAVCCLTNSQGRDPRTPEMLRWAAPCPGAAPNSQGWGPQDAKRPVCPPFSGTLSLLVPLFCFRPPTPCPWAAPYQRFRHQTKARPLRCGLCLLVIVDTLPSAVPTPLGAWPPQASVPATSLACSSAFPADQLSASWAAALG